MDKKPDGADETNEAETTFIAELENDFLEVLRYEDNPRNRRNTVRTTYSFIEGVMFHCRAKILERAGQTPGMLTTAETAVLKEESYIVTGKENIQTQTRYLTFEQSVRLSLRYFFSQVVEEVPIDYGDGGWEALLKGEKVRNRITHPKRLNDLSVSDEEMEWVLRGVSWFRSTHHRLATALHEKLTARSAECRAQSSKSRHIVSQLMLLSINRGYVVQTSWQETNTPIRGATYLRRKPMTVRLPTGELVTAECVEPDKDFPSQVTFPVRLYFGSGDEPSLESWTKEQ